VDQLNFSDVLSHWEGRFHTITLEDRNLPLIAHKRVLRPKNDACRAELEDAFEKTAQVRNEIMEVLLTREADRGMFKLVYPFSPALIQALVAVSSALQRERTALKIMLQLLVNRRDTLRLGDVIPLGDLWDVVAHGDEAFTDVMRVNFENAKKLYQTKLLPMLEQQHEVDVEVDRERAKTSTTIAEKLQRFENDDRLVKSLLLSALVHGVDALKNMSCTKLAALNHGTIRSRIPGREHQVVAQKLRQWVDLSGGVIHLSDDPVNPIVSIQLSGVETESIIEAAHGVVRVGLPQVARTVGGPQEPGEGEETRSHETPHRKDRGGKSTPKHTSLSGWRRHVNRCSRVQSLDYHRGGVLEGVSSRRSRRPPGTPPTPQKIAITSSARQQPYGRRRLAAYPASCTRFNSRSDTVKDLHDRYCRGIILSIKWS
jgi:hypothetical protein